MLIDSVRNDTIENQIMAEASLIRAALLGNPPILSPNQAMDSLAVQNLILANNVDGFKQNSFCSAVEKGIVKVALPEQYRDLTDWCLSTLQRSVDNEKNEFVISGLKFLYEHDDQGNPHYPYHQRCELIKAIIQRIRAGRRNTVSSNLPTWLTDLQKDLVEQYITSVVLLDRAIDTYENFTSQRQFFPLLLSRLLIDYQSKVESEPEILELLGLVLSESTAPNAPFYRSYYYRFVDNNEGIYGKECCDKIRSVIDIAYNRMIAMSINTGSEISVPNQYGDLSEAIICNDEPQCSFLSSYRSTTVGENLNWDMVIWIYDEVQAIMEERGLTWWDALQLLYAREKRMPFLLGGKYLFFTAMKVLISGIIPGAGMAIDYVTELIQNEMERPITDRFSIPSSIKEAKDTLVRANNAVHLLDTTIYNERIFQ